MSNWTHWFVALTVAVGPVTACGGGAATSTEGSGGAWAASGGYANLTGSGGVAFTNPDPSCTLDPPAFNPRGAEPFSACGGDVVGKWKLTEVRSTGGAVYTQEPVQDWSRAECPADLEVLFDAQAADFVLELDADSFANSPDIQLSTRIKYLDSCSRTSRPYNRECDVNPPSPRTCTSRCGVCDCTNELKMNGESISRWSKNESQLTLNPFSTPLVFDYCASGAHLVLRAEGLQLTFDNAAPPTACTGVAAACSTYAATMCGRVGCSPVSDCQGPSGTAERRVPRASAVIRRTPVARGQGRAVKQGPRRIAGPSTAAPGPFAASERRRPARATRATNASSTSVVH